ncbi:lysozyme family protein [Mesorhizobium xinjiangense]|uniref:conjugal transfer protein TraH n=1 Tax=Mesorhizobium xinjiangense TaxID=2678685 RepID=UPI0012ED0DE1|nr:conjugal transfer protein TraH [Mesorhizobium xinjiangense]
MFELALIQQCADPGVEIGIVERFISEVGSDNPLAVRITSGNRVILPEAPQTPDAALRLIAHYLGQAVVRVGITQYPAGHGITDASELNSDLLDACGNIQMGSTLFGKVYRIVAHAHGETSAEVFTEALKAWQTGMFEGRYVFGEEDPGPLPTDDEAADRAQPAEHTDEQESPTPDIGEASGGDGMGDDPNQAGIRVDISGLTGER